MVAFNKGDNQAVISTGLSNSSRGMPADDSLGLLFKGVGDTLANGVNAFDESTKVKIQMAADQAVNGPNGAVAEATPDANGNLPPGAQASLGSIASYKAALDQGTISQVTFDNRVAMEAKRIRSTVPAGYGPMVESALSAAVGSSTANQARQTQNAAIREAQNNISAAHKEMNTWMDKNQEHLMDDNVRANFANLTGGKMTVEQMITSPDEQYMPLLKLAVANRQAIDSNFNRVQHEIQTRDLIRNDQVNVMADKFIGDSFNPNVSKEFGALIAAKNTASAANSPGGASWTAEEEKQVAAAYQAFNLGARMNLENWLATTQVGEDVREKIRNRIDERMKAWTSYLDDPHMGALGAADRLFNGQMSEVARKLAGSNDAMVFIMAMQKQGMPPDIISAVLNRMAEGKGKEELIKGLSDPAIMASLGGIVSIPKAAETLAESSDNPSKEIRDLYMGIAKSLNVDPSNTAGTAAMAKQIFDPKNKDMLNKLASENRIGMFEKLVTPEMFGALVKSGDQGALSFATQWANDQFDVIAKSAKDTIWDRQANSSNLSFKFENGRFTVTSTQPSAAENFVSNVSGGSLMGIWGARQDSSAMQAVSDINRYIAVMEPVWKANGLDVQTALVGKFGDPASVGKSGSLMESLVGALISSISPVSKAEAASPGYNDKPSANNPAVRDGIRSAAAALGIDAVDLATAISYETKGTFNPTMGGPTTQWGRHRGLLQFGEPQAAQYGVNWDDPINSQLGPDGAVVKYLKAAGVKPGMGLMEIYSAINAGHVGRENASDANNGGAPGTVADKVNTQMSGHRERARLLMMST